VPPRDEIDSRQGGATLRVYHISQSSRPANVGYGVDTVEKVRFGQKPTLRATWRERGRVTSPRQRRHPLRDQLRQLSEVLCGGCEEELVTGPIWAS
jgi:hypothetical protein